MAFIDDTELFEIAEMSEDERVAWCKKRLAEISEEPEVNNDTGT